MNIETRSMRSIGVLAILIAAAFTAVGAQTSSPKLLAVLSVDPKGPRVLGVIDPATGKMLGSVPVGLDAAGAAVSEDGKFAYVADTNSHGKTRPDGDTISVVDLTTMKEVKKVPAGNGTRPHEVHVAGGRVYFTAEGYKALGRYDPAGNRVEYFGLGQDGPHMIAISKDMNTIYAANHGTNNVTVLQGAKEGPAGAGHSATELPWSISAISVGKAPEGIDMSPDGKEVWTANEEGGGASIIDVAKKTSQNLDLQTKHSNRLRFTPDGKYVLMLDRETDETVVVDAAARKVAKKIKMPGGGVNDLAVVPDSSRAFVSASGGSAGKPYIAEINMKTLEIARQIETQGRPGVVVWVAPK